VNRPKGVIGGLIVSFLLHGSSVGLIASIFVASVGAVVPDRPRPRGDRPPLFRALGMTHVALSLYRLVFAAAYPAVAVVGLVLMLAAAVVFACRCRHAT
jgi:hypothetical protein